MELIIVTILDSSITQLINQKQQIARPLYCFQKVDGKQECNVFNNIFRLATKEIEVGEELYFDYGDKFKTKWL